MKLLLILLLISSSVYGDELKYNPYEHTMTYVQSQRSTVTERDLSNPYARIHYINPYANIYYQNPYIQNNYNNKPNPNPYTRFYRMNFANVYFRPNQEVKTELKYNPYTKQTVYTKSNSILKYNPYERTMGYTQPEKNK